MITGKGQVRNIMSPQTQQNSFPLFLLFVLGDRRRGWGDYTTEWRLTNI